MDAVVMEGLCTWAQGSPTWVWGMVSRGIGLTLLISFVSIGRQIMTLAGASGITPVRESLAAITRDFPAPQRYLYFPTLLWISRRDGFLGALPWLGALGAAGIVAGGPHVAWLFGLCFVLYLSLDRAATLIYPWDCLLFEATFWGIFLPPTTLLGVQAVSAPEPALAWVYRLMIFRVMVGFGKHKFLGSTAQDSGFLKGFFVNQPIPTPLGLWTARLPLPVHKLALWVMFVVELPLQLLVFAPGPLSAVGGLATMLLMVGIQLTGNFGYFNLAMLVLSLSWFDQQTAQQLTLAGLAQGHGLSPVTGLALMHTSLALFVFPFNSFCAHSWMLWSPFLRLRPRFLAWPVDLMRFLHPLRLVHAYGVFPPQSPPPVKLSPVTEVSWDGQQFEALAHRYFPTRPDSRGALCAPHHDRIEQAMIYEGSGINEGFVYRNIAGRFDPYGHGGVSTPRRMLEQLVNGRFPRSTFYDRSLERGRGAPTHARVRVHALSLAAEGNGYACRLVGPHLPQIARGEISPRLTYPPPELFHFEDVYWLLRSRLGRHYVREAPSRDPHTLALWNLDGANASLQQRFWDELTGAPMGELNVDWQGLRAEVDRVRTTFTASERVVVERVAARYRILLFFKLLPDFLNQGLWSAFQAAQQTDAIAPSLYHLHMLAAHITLQGRGAFDEVWAEPRRALGYRAEVSMTSSHLLQALFRYEEFVYNSQKLRLLERTLKHSGRTPPTDKALAAQERLTQLGQRLWGGLAFAGFLKGQFTGPQDQLDVPERWPHFRITAEAEVVPDDGD